MKKIITNLFICVPTLLVLGLSAPATAAAATACPANTTPQGQVLTGVTQGSSNPDCSGQGVSDLIANVVTILSVVLGAVAVIMIILAGFKYVTSGGDSNRISSAKNTLIYALVGLVVAALAQFMVHFVINRSTAIACKSNPAVLASDAACK